MAVIDLDAMVKKVKLKIGVDGDANAPVLKLMMEDAVMAITLFCNCTVFPWQLEYIARQMVVTEFERENGDNVASIKRGDTQINYAATITADDMTMEQKDICSKFRKFRTI